jgi:hypothetical protein
VIVFGPLRGGTTLLRLMLDGHPMLSCIGESDYLVDHLRPAGGEWRYDRDALARDRIFRTSGLRLRDDLDGTDALWDMVGQIGRGGTIPVLMLHRGMTEAAALMPEAPVIRFTRDPRDSARSAIGMGWAGDVYHGATPWLRTERSWRAYEEAGGRRARVHRLRYEDLVADPEARLGEVCDFIGVPYDDGLLAYPATTTYDAPDAALAFQWRRKLARREVALVEHRVGDLMAGSGYEPSGVPAAPPTAAERARLRLANRWYVWRTMVGRYGVVAPVMRGLGRRLGLRAFERLGSRRIETEMVKHLK